MGRRLPALLLPKDAAEAAQMDPGLVACTEAYRDFSFMDGVSRHGPPLRLCGGGERLVRRGRLRPAGDAEPPPSPPSRWGCSGRRTGTPHDWDWLVWAEFSYPFNLSHGPAISVPCGLTAAGLPVGLQTRRAAAGGQPGAAGRGRVPGGAALHAGFATP